MRLSFFGKIGAVAVALGLAATVCATELSAALVRVVGTGPDWTVSQPTNANPVPAEPVAPYDDPVTPPDMPGLFDWAPPLKGTQWITHPDFAAGGQALTNADNGRYLYRTEIPLSGIAGSFVFEVTYFVDNAVVEFAFCVIDCESRRPSMPGGLNGVPGKERFYYSQRLGNDLPEAAVLLVFVENFSSLFDNPTGLDLRGELRSIPEPASITLLGIALMGFGFANRKRWMRAQGL